MRFATGGDFPKSRSVVVKITITTTYREWDELGVFRELVTVNSDDICDPSPKECG